MGNETIPTARLEEIRELAAKATPGPWTAYHDTCAQCEKNGTAEYGISQLPGGYHAPFGEKADAHHIANCDPQTISAIVSENLEARQLIRDLLLIDFDGPTEHDQLLLETVLEAARKMQPELIERRNKVMETGNG